MTSIGVEATALAILAIKLDLKNIIAFKCTYSLHHIISNVILI